MGHSSSQQGPGHEGRSFEVDNDPFLSHARASARGERKVTPGAGYKPKQQEALNTPLWLFVVPVLLFLGISLVFTGLWQLNRTIPTLAAVVALIFSVSVAQPDGSAGRYAHEVLPSLNGENKSAAVRAWLRIVLGLLAVFLGMAIGLQANEMYMRQYYAIALGREYSNVIASSPGAAYADAGKVFFAKSSKVDTDRAVGFKEGPTYCVAPIMDSGAMQGKTVAFWAIGINCCGERGDFTCGDGDAGKVQGGVRAAPDTSFDKDDMDWQAFFWGKPHVQIKDSKKFYRAARLAAAVNDLKIDEDSILLHWVQDPNSESAKSLLTALGTDVLGAALFALLVLALDAFGLRHEHSVET